MANLLADPDLWFDQGANNPPLSWDAGNGAYEFASGFGAFVIQTNDTPDGTVAGTISFANEDALPAFLNLVNRETLAVIGSQAVNSGDTGIEFSFTASGSSDGYALIIATSADGAFESQFYGLVLTIVPAEEPPVVEVRCEEHGRVTRAYVSGYQRDRVHRSRLVRGERRCLVANFNGAIPPARTIARVIWRCDQNQSVYMENARIVREGREVAVDITAQIGWGARVKCEAVLDNGEVYTQLFVIRVVSTPYFMGEPTWCARGPTELTATA